MGWRCRTIPRGSDVGGVAGVRSDGGAEVRQREVEGEVVTGLDGVALRRYDWKHACQMLPSAGQEGSSDLDSVIVNTTQADLRKHPQDMKALVR